MEGRPRGGGGALAAETHTSMSVGQKPAGRLGMPILGTWEWGSWNQRSRPSRNGGPVSSNLLTAYFPGNWEVGFQALFPHF